MSKAANQIEETIWQQSIYEQLREVAEKALQLERPGHSLQPTLLVNDAYLRLLEQRNVNSEDRSAVMATGATIIRRLLVDYARKRKSLKRGGEKGRGIPLHLLITADANADNDNQLEVLELNEALELLGQRRPRAAQVVELKFFGGLTSQEVSEQIGVSLHTVKNDWRIAKAWLYRELGSNRDDTEAS